MVVTGLNGACCAGGRGIPPVAVSFSVVIVTGLAGFAGAAGCGVSSSNYEFLRCDGHR